MERESIAVMTWTGGYRPGAGALPRLRINEDSSRRDSLSSDRTRDSGYNSDPEISLSPLDFVGADSCQYPALNPLAFDHPSGTEVTLNLKPKRPACGPILFKIQKEHPRVIPLRHGVTSNPIPENSALEAEKLNWTKAFKCPVQDEALQTSNRNDEVEQWIKGNLPSQDRPEQRVSSIVSISSTGSGDMYSIADGSDAEEMLDAASSTLSKTTTKTIELILRKIELNLRYMAHVQSATGNSSRRQSATVASARNNRGSVNSSNGKRKSRSDDNFLPDDPDDDGSRKRRRVSIATTEDSEAGPRFACPFYKHDPNRYRSRRTCPGPGWPTVHRMKEHLYRSHAQPIVCPRCYNMFDTDNEFATHLRSHACEVAAPQPIEGIDRETLLNLRRRSTANRLEEDKWRDTYQLLFPDVSAADIPSPYYDSDSPTEESRRFRRELLERIRRELFATAEREAGPVEQNLLRQVAGIIQRCEGELLASPYPSLLHPRSASGPQSHPVPPRSVVPDTTQPKPQPAFSAPELPPDHEPPVQFNPPVWGDPFAGPSTTWIDWDVVFPYPEAQIPGRETPLSTPVWT